MEICTSLDILRKIEEKAGQAPENPKFIRNEKGRIVRYSKFWFFRFALANFITRGYLDDMIGRYDNLSNLIRRWRAFVESGGGYGVEIADQVADRLKA